MKRFLEHHRDERRFAHRDTPFRHGLRDRFDVDRLKVFFIKFGARCLSGDTQDGNRIRAGGIKSGDHVGARGTRGADTHTDIPGLRPRVAFGHVRGSLHMPSKDMADRRPGTQRRIQRVNRGARYAKGTSHTLHLQYPYRRVNRSHFCHDSIPR